MEQSYAGVWACSKIHCMKSAHNRKDKLSNLEQPLGQSNFINGNYKDQITSKGWFLSFLSTSQDKCYFMCHSSIRVMDVVLKIVEIKIVRSQ